MIWLFDYLFIFCWSFILMLVCGWGKWMKPNKTIDFVWLEMKQRKLDLNSRNHWSLLAAANHCLSYPNPRWLQLHLVKSKCTHVAVTLSLGLPGAQSTISLISLLLWMHWCPCHIKLYRTNTKGLGLLSPFYFSLCILDDIKKFSNIKMEWK